MKIIRNEKTTDSKKIWNTVDLAASHVPEWVRSRVNDVSIRRAADIANKSKMPVTTINGR